MTQTCTKCRRKRPSYIADPSCSRGGYCAWTSGILDILAPEPPPMTEEEIRAFVASQRCAICGAKPVVGAIMTRNPPTIVSLGTSDGTIPPTYRDDFGY